MKCPKCNSTIADSANFCPNCGKKIGAKVTYAPNRYDKGAQTRRSAKIIIFSVIAIALVVGVLNFPSHHENSYYGTQTADSDYAKALDYAKNGDWNDASAFLVMEKSKGGKYAAIYNYSNAQKAYGDRDILFAESYLEDIPTDYDGDLADEIKRFKNEISPLVQQEKAKKAKADAEREKHIYIGDYETKIEQVYGKPDSINRTVIGNQVSKQYVYDRGSKMIFIYTTNGVVTSFQD